MSEYIFVINLGGTSTKASIYKGTEHVATCSLSHSVEEMEMYPLSRDQVAFRRELLEAFLSENDYSIDDFDAIVMRSPPVYVRKCGTYLVKGICRDKILSFYHPNEIPEHGNRFSLPLIEAMLDDRDVPVFIVDPPNLDEFLDIAHVSGIPGIQRKPAIHVLNQKAVARKYAESIGKRYDELNLIVAHLGGGISIGAHEKGRVIDANNGGEGWGPFSTNRAGTVAADTMMKICFDKGLSREEVHQMIRGNAGLKGLLGTTDLRDVEARMNEGDEYAELIFRTMAFQIAKEIGSCYTALCCDVDAIIYTGGMSYSKKLLAEIGRYVDKLADKEVYPGEMEQDALALGAYRVLKGQEDPIIMIE